MEKRQSRDRSPFLRPQEVVLTPGPPPGFRGVRLPHFDEIELLDDSRSAGVIGAVHGKVAASAVRDTLWNASTKEMDRLAMPGSRWTVTYHPSDLVFVPRDECEVRLWTIAYPNRREFGASPSSAPRARLRRPELADQRKWRRMTLGEFHRQRKFFGLQEVGGRVSCVRTMDAIRMVRIPLTALRVTAPLFSRMLELPWFNRDAPGESMAPSPVRAPARGPRGTQDPSSLALRRPAPVHP